MSVNKVQLANGETIIDISDSTVTPETLAEGVTAHDASGQKITGKMIPGGGRSVQSDWNQNDSSAADFIKNKPFGEGQGYILPEQELPYDPDNEGCLGFMDGAINEGDTVTVVYDGVSYVCTAALDPDMGGVFFGNFSMIGAGDDTGEPFLAFTMETAVIFLSLDATSHIIGIISNVVKKLPAEYVEVRTFYVSLDDKDPYIYTDLALENKATKEEIIATAKIQNFRLAISVLGIPTIAMPVLSVPISAQDNFKVFAFNQQIGDIRTYRTAEYTEG